MDVKNIEKQIEIIGALRVSLENENSEYSRKAILDSIEIESKKLLEMYDDSDKLKKDAFKYYGTSNNKRKLNFNSYFNEIEKKKNKGSFDIDLLEYKENELTEREKINTERLSKITEKELDILNREKKLGQRSDILIKLQTDLRDLENELENKQSSFEAEVQSFRKERFDFSESKVIKENAIRIIEDAYKSRQKSKDSLFQASYLYASMMMIMIFLGMFILFQVYQDSVNFYKEDINWVTAVFYILKNAFILGAYIIGLKFLANFSDKYFKAARQEEDRIHNMTYGKFYVETYASVLDTSEIKEALCGWGSKGNIDSQIKEDSIQLNSKDMKELISFLPTMKKLSKTFSMSDKKSDSESDK